MPELISKCSCSLNISRFVFKVVQNDHQMGQNLTLLKLHMAKQRRDQLITELKKDYKNNNTFLNEKSSNFHDTYYSSATHNTLNASDCAVVNPTLQLSVSSSSKSILNNMNSTTFISIAAKPSYSISSRQYFRSAIINSFQDGTRTRGLPYLAPTGESTVRLVAMLSRVKNFYCDANSDKSYSNAHKVMGDDGGEASSELPQQGLPSSTSLSNSFYVYHIKRYLSSNKCINSSIGWSNGKYGSPVQGDRIKRHNNELHHAMRESLCKHFISFPFMDTPHIPATFTYSDDMNMDCDSYEVPDLSIFSCARESVSPSNNNRHTKSFNNHNKKMSSRSKREKDYGVEKTTIFSRQALERLSPYLQAEFLDTPHRVTSTFLRTDSLIPVWEENYKEIRTIEKDTGDNYSSPILRSSLSSKNLAVPSSFSYLSENVENGPSSPFVLSAVLINSDVNNLVNLMTSIPPPSGLVSLAEDINDNVLYLGRALISTYFHWFIQHVCFTGRTYEMSFCEKDETLRPKWQKRCQGHWPTVIRFRDGEFLRVLFSRRGWSKKKRQKHQPEEISRQARDGKETTSLMMQNSLLPHTENVTAKDIECGVCYKKTFTTNKDKGAEKESERSVKNSYIMHAGNNFDINNHDVDGGRNKKEALSPHHSAVSMEQESDINLSAESMIFGWETQQNKHDPSFLALSPGHYQDPNLNIDPAFKKAAHPCENNQERGIHFIKDLKFPFCKADDNAFTETFLPSIVYTLAKLLEALQIPPFLLARLKYCDILGERGGGRGGGGQCHNAMDEYYHNKLASSLPQHWQSLEESSSSSKMKMGRSIDITSSSSAFYATFLLRLLFASPLKASVAVISDDHNYCRPPTHCLSTTSISHESRPRSSSFSSSFTTRGSDGSAGTTLVNHDGILLVRNRNALAMGDWGIKPISLRQARYDNEDDVEVGDVEEGEWSTVTHQTDSMDEATWRPEVLGALREGGVTNRSTFLLKVNAGKSSREHYSVMDYYSVFLRGSSLGMENEEKMMKISTGFNFNSLLSDHNSVNSKNILSDYHIPKNIKNPLSNRNESKTNVNESLEKVLRLTTQKKQRLLFVLCQYLLPNYYSFCYEYACGRELFSRYGGLQLMDSPMYLNLMQNRKQERQQEEERQYLRMDETKMLSTLSSFPAFPFVLPRELQQLFTTRMLPHLSCFNRPSFITVSQPSFPFYQERKLKKIIHNGERDSLSLSTTISTMPSFSATTSPSYQVAFLPRCYNVTSRRFAIEGSSSLALSKNKTSETVAITAAASVDEGSTVTNAVGARVVAVPIFAHIGSVKCPLKERVLGTSGKRKNENKTLLNEISTRENDNLTWTRGFVSVQRSLMSDKEETPSISSPSYLYSDFNNHHYYYKRRRKCVIELVLPRRYINAGLEQYVRSVPRLCSGGAKFQKKKEALDVHEPRSFLENDTLCDHYLDLHRLSIGHETVIGGGNVVADVENDERGGFNDANKVKVSLGRSAAILCDDNVNICHCALLLFKDFKITHINGISINNWQFSILRNTTKKLLIPLGTSFKTWRTRQRRQLHGYGRYEVMARDYMRLKKKSVEGKVGSTNSIWRSDDSTKTRLSTLRESSMFTSPLSSSGSIIRNAVRSPSVHFNTPLYLLLMLRRMQREERQEILRTLHSEQQYQSYHLLRSNSVADAHTEEGWTFFAQSALNYMYHRRTLGYLLGRLDTHSVYPQYWMRKCGKQSTDGTMQAGLHGAAITAKTTRETFIDSHYRYLTGAFSASLTDGSLEAAYVGAWARIRGRKKSKAVTASANSITSPLKTKSHYPHNFFKREMPFKHSPSLFSDAVQSYRAALRAISVARLRTNASFISLVSYSCSLSDVLFNTAEKQQSVRGLCEGSLGKEGGRANEHRITSQIEDPLLAFLGDGEYLGDFIREKGKVETIEKREERYEKDQKIQRKEISTHLLSLSSVEREAEKFLLHHTQERNFLLSNPYFSRSHRGNEKSGIFSLKRWHPTNRFSVPMYNGPMLDAARIRRKQVRLRVESTYCVDNSDAQYEAVADHYDEWGSDGKEETCIGCFKDNVNKFNASTFFRNARNSHHHHYRNEDKKIRNVEKVLWEYTSPIKKNNNNNNEDTVVYTVEDDEDVDEVTTTLASLRTIKEALIAYCVEVYGKVLETDVTSTRKDSVSLPSVTNTQTQNSLPHLASSSCPSLNPMTTIPLADFLRHNYMTLSIIQCYYTFMLSLEKGGRSGLMNSCKDHLSQVTPPLQLQLMLSPSYLLSVSNPASENANCIQNKRVYTYNSNPRDALGLTSTEQENHHLTSLRYSLSVENPIFSPVNHITNSKLLSLLLPSFTRTSQSNDVIITSNNNTNKHVINSCNSSAKVLYDPLSMGESSSLQLVTTGAVGVNRRFRIAWKTKENEKSSAMENMDNNHNNSAFSHMANIGKISRVLAPLLPHSTSSALAAYHRTIIVPGSIHQVNRVLSSNPLLTLLRIQSPYPTIFRSYLSRPLCSYQTMVRKWSGILPLPFFAYDGLADFVANKSIEKEGFGGGELEESSREDEQENIGAMMISDEKNLMDGKEKEMGEGVILMETKQNKGKDNLSNVNIVREIRNNKILGVIDREGGLAGFVDFMLHSLALKGQGGKELDGNVGLNFLSSSQASEYIAQNSRQSLAEGNEKETGNKLLRSFSLYNNNNLLANQQYAEYQVKFAIKSPFLSHVVHQASVDVNNAVSTNAMCYFVGCGLVESSSYVRDGSLCLKGWLSAMKNSAVMNGEKATTIVHNNFKEKNTFVETYRNYHKIAAIANTCLCHHHYAFPFSSVLALNNARAAIRTHGTLVAQTMVNNVYCNNYEMCLSAHHCDNFINCNRKKFCDGDAFSILQTSQKLPLEENSQHNSIEFSKLSASDNTTTYHYQHPHSVLTPFPEVYSAFNNSYMTTTKPYILTAVSRIAVDDGNDAYEEWFNHKCNSSAGYFYSKKGNGDFSAAKTIIDSINMGARRKIRKPLKKVRKRKEENQHQLLGTEVGTEPSFAFFLSPPLYALSFFKLSLIRRCHPITFTYSNSTELMIPSVSHTARHLNNKNNNIDDDEFGDIKKSNIKNCNINKNEDNNIESADDDNDHSVTEFLPSASGDEGGIFTIQNLSRNVYLGRVVYTSDIESRCALGFCLKANAMNPGLYIRKICRGHLIFAFSRFYSLFVDIFPTLLSTNNSNLREKGDESKKASLPASQQLYYGGDMDAQTVLEVLKNNSLLIARAIEEIKAKFKGENLDKIDDDTNCDHGTNSCDTVGTDSYNDVFVPLRHYNDAEILAEVEINVFLKKLIDEVMARINYQAYLGILMQYERALSQYAAAEKKKIYILTNEIKNTKRWGSLLQMTLFSLMNTISSSTSSNNREYRQSIQMPQFSVLSDPRSHIEENNLKRENITTSSQAREHQIQHEMGRREEAFSSKTSFSSFSPQGPVVRVQVGSASGEPVVNCADVLLDFKEIDNNNNNKESNNICILGRKWSDCDRDIIMEREPVAKTNHGGYHHSLLWPDFLSTSQLLRKSILSSYDDLSGVVFSNVLISTSGMHLAPFLRTSVMQNYVNASIFLSATVVGKSMSSPKGRVVLSSVSFPCHDQEFIENLASEENTDLCNDSLQSNTTILMPIHKNEEKSKGLSLFNTDLLKNSKFSPTQHYTSSVSDPWDMISKNVLINRIYCFTSYYYTVCLSGMKVPLSSAVSSKISFLKKQKSNDNYSSTNHNHNNENNKSHMRPLPINKCVLTHQHPLTYYTEEELDIYYHHCFYRHSPHYHSRGSLQDYFPSIITGSYPLFFTAFNNCLPYGGQKSNLLFNSCVLNNATGGSCTNPNDVTVTSSPMVFPLCFGYINWSLVDSRLIEGERFFSNYQRYSCVRTDGNGERTNENNAEIKKGNDGSLFRQLAKQYLRRRAGCTEKKVDDCLGSEGENNKSFADTSIFSLSSSSDVLNRIMRSHVDLLSLLESMETNVFSDVSYNPHRLSSHNRNSHHYFHDQHHQTCSTRRNLVSYCLEGRHGQGITALVLTNFFNICAALTRTEEIIFGKLNKKAGEMFIGGRRWHCFARTNTIIGLREVKQRQKQNKKKENLKMGKKQRNKQQRHGTREKKDQKIYSASSLLKPKMQIYQDLFKELQHSSLSRENFSFCELAEGMRRLFLFSYDSHNVSSRRSLLILLMELLESPLHALLDVNAVVSKIDSHATRDGDEDDDIYENALNDENHHDHEKRTGEAKRSSSSPTQPPPAFTCNISLASLRELTYVDPNCCKVLPFALARVLVQLQAGVSMDVITCTPNYNITCNNTTNGWNEGDDHVSNDVEHPFYNKKNKLYCLLEEMAGFSSSIEREKYVVSSSLLNETPTTSTLTTKSTLKLYPNINFNMEVHVIVLALMYRCCPLLLCVASPFFKNNSQIISHGILFDFYFLDFYYQLLATVAELVALYRHACGNNIHVSMEGGIPAHVVAPVVCHNAVSKNEKSSSSILWSFPIATETALSSSSLFSHTLNFQEDINGCEANNNNNPSGPSSEKSTIVNCYNATAKSSNSSASFSSTSPSFTSCHSSAAPYVSSDTSYLHSAYAVSNCGDDVVGLFDIPQLPEVPFRGKEERAQDVTVVGHGDAVAACERLRATERAVREKDAFFLAFMQEFGLLEEEGDGRGGGVESEGEKDALFIFQRKKECDVVGGEGEGKVKELVILKEMGKDHIKEDDRGDGYWSF